VKLNRDGVVSQCKGKVFLCEGENWGNHGVTGRSEGKWGAEGGVAFKGAKGCF